MKKQVCSFTWDLNISKNTFLFSSFPTNGTVGSLLRVHQLWTKSVCLDLQAGNATLGVLCCGILVNPGSASTVLEYCVKAAGSEAQDRTLPAVICWLSCNGQWWTRCVKVLGGDSHLLQLQDKYTHLENCLGETALFSLLSVFNTTNGLDWNSYCETFVEKEMISCFWRWLHCLLGLPCPMLSLRHTWQSSG